MELRVKVQNVKGCRRRIEVEVPAEEVREAFRGAASRWARSVRITGFRKGKAPIAMVRRKFAQEIEREVGDRLIPDRLGKALQSERLEPIQDPVLESYELKEGSALIIRAVFDIAPEIRISGYKDLRVTGTRKAVTGEAVEESLRFLQKRAARFLPVEGRPVEPGDFLVGALSGGLEGKPGEKAAGQTVTLDLEDEDLLPEFRSAIPGMEVGQERVFSVTYPAAHPDAGLAGKRIEYRFQLREIKKRELPPLDDPFAREIGSFDSLEDLRQAVRKDLEKEAEKAWQGEARREILDQVLARHKIDLPESMVQAELHSRAEEALRHMKFQDWDRQRARAQYDQALEQQRPAAEKGVKATLLLEAIASREGIDVAEKEMNERLREEAARQKRTVAALKEEMNRQGRWNALKRAVLREKALDFLMRNVNIS